MSDLAQSNFEILRPLEFDTAVVIYNPNRPKAVHQAELAEDKLAQIGLPKVVVEPSHARPEDYKAMLAQYDSEAANTVWVVVGGDGTHSNFANARPESPVLIMPAGYGNDKAHMLHGRYHRGKPDRMIQEGRIAQIRPIEVSAQASSYDVASTELAFGYFGVGLSGYIASLFDAPEYHRLRDSRSFLGKLLGDAIKINSNLSDNPVLRVGQDGKEFERSELLYVNGRRMARVLRFGTVNILDNEIARLELKNNRRAELALGIGMATLGKVQNLGDFDHTHNFRVSSDRPFFSQRDGEVTEHEQPTDFQIKLSDYQLNVITTK